MSIKNHKTLRNISRLKIGNKAPKNGNVEFHRQIDGLGGNEYHLRGEGIAMKKDHVVVQVLK